MNFASASSHQNDGLPRALLVTAALFVSAACGNGNGNKADDAERGPAPAASAPAGSAAGAVPADGKYERVLVDGVTVPMINVMNHGAVVLVDTDGAKPRTWEEQYKRKRDLPAGQFDLHKTDANKNGSFDDDAVDREGLWQIDAKGNITKR